MAAVDDLTMFLQTVITTDAGNLVLLVGPPGALREEWYEWPDNFSRVVERITDLKDQETNVYFSPHLFSDRHSLKTNVLPTRTIVADLDHADVSDLDLNPTLLVETSPGRHQGYWVLDEYLPLDQFENLSKKLSYTIPNCDHSGWPLGHRFRVPTTHNQKYAIPAPIRLVPAFSSEREYQPHEILTFTADADAIIQTATSNDQWILHPPTSWATGPRETLEKYKAAVGTKIMQYYSVVQTDRSEALWAMMMALFRAGATRDEVYWIAKHSENNKFATNRYNGEQDLAKDVDRAQRSVTTDKGDIRKLIAMAQKSQGTTIDKKKLVTKIVVADMLNKGEFIYTDDGRYWYLHENAGRPIQLGKRSEQLEALLDTVYDLNPSDGYQTHVVNHLISYTVSKGRRANIGVLSQTTRDGLLLHSGKADVYHITATTISRIHDGQQGTLFPWRSMGEESLVVGDPLPVHDWSEWLFDDGWFENLLELTPQQARALIRVWTLFVLFRDMAVSRPILAVFGQPGSGKSTLFRLLYTLLYGKNKNLNAISTPDDFDFLVAADPLVVFDNVDTWNNWLPDRLALSASASDLIKRKLYTDSDTVVLKRQAMLGLTAHDPRFGRADVVDRLLIMNLERRGTFKPESLMLNRVQQNRARLWGSIVRDVQQVLLQPEPAASEIPEFRISDFARIGARIAQALDLHELFVETIAHMRRIQVAFALGEEDVLVDVIKRWHAVRPQNMNGRDPFTSVGLLWETFDAIEPTFSKTYKSGNILARRLWATQSNLRAVFSIDFKYDAQRGVRLWRIDPK